jgi:threonine/homoserine/homoserine lactone efflux protein
VTIGQAVLGFAAVVAVLTVIPGLDTTLVLRAAVVRGRRLAFATAFGVGTGALVWGAAAAVGAAALLAASEFAYRVVTLAGAAYMIYLGASMIVKSTRRHQISVDHAPTTPASAWRSFATGLWTNLLNPKIGVFYIATIPQFIPEGVPHLAMGLLLAAVHDVLGLAWFALIIIAAGAMRRWLTRPRALRLVDAVAGTVLVGFGAKLALQHR